MHTCYFFFLSAADPSIVCKSLHAYIISPPSRYNDDDHGIIFFTILCHGYAKKKKNNNKPSDFYTRIFY